ncbi:CRP/FNR family transcriptional regulator [Mangrovibacterium diazotrophicum]|uniref:CRP/FNR family transcriptional regulator n=2 Tax=Mangrovibacterium diazotrophicum TaxID=1261403 RepID=A0A419VYX6_9BACT|nr:CRP/FNR family transcriptional regulator [Mangrovibacterium diazotrophicum]
MFDDSHKKDCITCRKNCCVNCFPENEAVIFKSLSADELEYLMQCKQNIVFNPGETIIKQKTSTTHFVCLREGMAKMVAESSRGKNVILRILANHSLITAGGVVSDDVRHFTVTAITRVECCFIDSDRLHHLLERNSRFAYELLKYNNHQNIQMLESLVGLTQKYMPGRVADTLLYLKNQIYQSNPFNCNLNKQELAEMSGMTKESFIRSLKELEISGIVRHNRREIEILKEDDLLFISKNG